MANRLALISLVAMLIPACTHRPTPVVAQAADKLPVICRLVSRDQTITISAGGHGPVYSVQDAKGQMLLSYASREELRLRHPTLSHQLDSTIATSDSREVSRPILSLDSTAGSVDRIQVPSSLFDGPLMLKVSE